MGNIATLEAFSRFVDLAFRRESAGTGPAPFHLASAFLVVSGPFGYCD